MFVQHLHVGMRRRAVEIEVKFLQVLAVIALLIRQPEEPFLDDRIMPVPERERYAPVERVVTESGNAVLAPAVHAAPCMFLRKVVPCAALFAVAFPTSPPFPLPQLIPP